MSTPCVPSEGDGITNTTILIIVNIVVSTILGLATAMRCRFKLGNSMFSFKPKDAERSPGSDVGAAEASTSAPVKKEEIELERTVSASHMEILKNAVAIVYEGYGEEGDDIEAQRYPPRLPTISHKYHPSASDKSKKHRSII